MYLPSAWHEENISWGFNLLAILTDNVTKRTSPQVVELGRRKASSLATMGEKVSVSKLRTVELSSLNGKITRDS